MYAKSSILAKLDELLQYSITKKPAFDSYYSSIVSDGKSSVNGYFSADRSKFKKPLDDLGLYLHNELWQRGAKWEKEFDMGLRNDFPESYNDLQKLFYDFNWLMNLSSDAFFNAWTYGLPEVVPVNEGSVTEQPLSNSYIDRLKSDLVDTLLDQELKNVNDLSDWVESSMSNSGSVSLWENQGALLEAPESKPLAYKIFLDMGFLEAIKTLNLPVYIPSYLEGDSHKYGGTYPSVKAMYADVNFEVGKYVVIASNDEDNGNLYLRTETEYSFITNVCGPRGLQGERGEKGEPFKFEDFTQAQLASLKGDKGDPFEYSDFTSEQLESLRGPVGPVGPQGSGGLPIGSLVQFPNVISLPTEYMVCDGSAISRTTYSSLFSLIGTTFGSGDGSTTFNLPKCSVSNGAIETWGDLKENKSNSIIYIIKVK